LTLAIDRESALERVLSAGDEWQSWRALRLDGEEPSEIPSLSEQDEVGAFLGPSGSQSPGATGFGLCHLKVLSLSDSPAAVIAADWLREAQTPARAWLDSPDEVPGDLDSIAGARVWATASATCGLLAVGGDPGPRAIDLLRGEADIEGRFTGGAYTTFAGAGAYWLAEGAKTEMAEWALRWVREQEEEWGPEEWTTGLIFWTAAGIPAEHPTVEAFLDAARRAAPETGWEDTELTLRFLELLRRLEG
jgi:hypothetical protein